MKRTRDDSALRGPVGLRGFFQRAGEQKRETHRGRKMVAEGALKAASYPVLLISGEAPSTSIQPSSTLILSAQEHHNTTPAKAPWSISLRLNQKDN